MTPIRVVLGPYPATARARTRNRFDGADVEWCEVRPVHRAFGPMMLELAYDVSELALLAFLQAVEAGRPLVLLPVVLTGALPQQCVVVREGTGRPGPAWLRGRRVGIRSYGQTTGLWVRQALWAQDGVHWSELAWVTEEGPRLQEYPDPGNVERSRGALQPVFERGGLDALVVPGGQASSLGEPLWPDPAGAAAGWLERFGVVPANHMVVATRRVLEERKEVLWELYDALAEGVEAERAERASAGALGGPVVRCGWDEVWPVVELAIEAGVAQGSLHGTGFAKEGLRAW